MNICLISREYPPHFGGGIGTYTRHFAAALAGAGHRAVVVTVSADGQERHEQEGGVTVVRLPFLNGDDWSAPHAAVRTPETLAAFRTFHPVSVFAMQVAAALPRIVGEFGIDVVEAPECGALAWFALNERRCGRGWGTNRAAGPPLVTHLHSPTAWIERWNRGGEGGESGRAAAWLKRMEEESVRWSDGVACPSGPLAEWAEEQWRLRSGGVEVIPYPLGPLEEQARIAVSAPRQTAAGECRVLFAGRLEPRKGVDTLLAGFVRCVQGGANLVLDLAGRDITDPATGRGYGRGWVEALVPESLRGRVRLHGELGPARLAELRQSSHVAIVPSPMDNYPYTLMEAMAEGLPVVAARAGGMSELVRDGIDGVLFEAGNACACAAALERCAAEEERRRLGPAAAARVLEVCGNARVVERRVAHYERVAGEGRARCPAQGSNRPVVVIAPPGVDVSAAGPLTDALDAAAGEAAARGEPEPVFAHGWTRLRPAAGSNGAEARALAFGTPTLDGLADGPRRIGPLVIRRSVLEEARLLARLTSVATEDGTDGPVVRADPWMAALLLVAAERPGVVVPWAVTELQGHQTPGAEPGGAWRVRAERAEAELRRIKASRGWRALQRVYRVLRTLRSGEEGRGRGRGAI